MPQALRSIRPDRATRAFLRLLNLVQSLVSAAWMSALAHGRMRSLVAFEGDALVGCTAIVIDPLSWSAHVGELRVLVDPSWRGRGLGRVLVQESFALALGLGLDKLVVRMTVDQHGAIALFEELGFRAEAVLRNQVKDREGRLRDLALLGHDIDAVNARMQVMGLDRALNA
ncbi:GNAT family N-acetyltransferase [Variovorax sp. OV329]|uniref:GNAT family N-acetyltransferase n=1 Tax=Variovorax sp. OV329 TaxID=1882825 RepID=UPI0008E8B200|nr:GNAT family N-acetyltransferase [Variovorax sp. OV329]SFN43644.1 L-amino acid N-acyltransferase YncA [Variovorax sp. OV329]